MARAWLLQCDRTFHASSHPNQDVSFRGFSCPCPAQSPDSVLTRTRIFQSFHSPGTENNSGFLASSYNGPVQSLSRLAQSNPLRKVPSRPQKTAALSAPLLKFCHELENATLARLREVSLVSKLAANLRNVSRVGDWQPFPGEAAASAPSGVYLPRPRIPSPHSTGGGAGVNGSTDRDHLKHEGLPSISPTRRQDVSSSFIVSSLPP